LSASLFPFELIADSLMNYSGRRPILPMVNHRAGEHSAHQSKK
jgi:hypothetical protein